MERVKNIVKGKSFNFVNRREQRNVNKSVAGYEKRILICDNYKKKKIPFLNRTKRFKIIKNTKFKFAENIK